MLTVLVVDERTKDAFPGEPDDREAYFYGWGGSTASD